MLQEFNRGYENFLRKPRGLNIDAVRVNYKENECEKLGDFHGARI